jgi:hypothetical protein
VLNHTFIPSAEDKPLFDLKNSYWYKVLVDIIQELSLGAIINAGPVGDGQTVWMNIVTEAEKSTMACISSQSLTAYLTTSKIRDGSWWGTDTAYLNHWNISYEVFGEEYWVYHLSVQMLVIATICQYQVIASHSYANFHSIDNLRQVLLNQYMERCGVSSIEPHLRKVYQDSSWEGGAPAILHHIRADDKIEGLYDIYTDRPVATPAPSDCWEK